MKNKEHYKDKMYKLIHPLVLKVLSVRRKFQIEITGEIPPGQQFVFIANHYCIDDIPTIAEVIHNHVYPLVSDEDRGTLNGLALNLNGVVWTNRLDKGQRKRSKDDIIKHLKLGHNVLMYPEATWNLSPNLLILPMNYGCVSISLETGVPIVPIYLYFTDKICHVEINPPFYPTDNKEESVEKLRDIMATSAWKFYEQEEQNFRKILNLDCWETNIEKRYAMYDRAKKDPIGVRKYESQFIFRQKGYVTNDEIFAHIKIIKPTLQNAFLFNKRLY